MNLEKQLDQRITKRLAKLRHLLSQCSTYSTIGWCFAQLTGPTQAVGKKGRLTSPLKQLPFLLAVLLSTDEPAEPVEFTEKRWALTKRILEDLFSAYVMLYLPEKEDLRELSESWRRSREVSMLAFLHFHNSGLLASVEQIVSRIKIYLVPFDSKLSVLFGFTASEAIEICESVRQTVQNSADDLGIIASRVNDVLNAGSSFDGTEKEFRRLCREEPNVAETLRSLLGGVRGFGLVSRTQIETIHPISGPRFWKQFSVRRGEGPEVKYPTEQSVAEERPLVMVDQTHAMFPSINSLFSAVLRTFERELTQSDAKDRFLRARDRALEAETREKIQLLLGPQAQVWSNVYETPDAQYEHDIVAVEGDVCLVVEVKATPPSEPFRNPERAFQRLRNAFRADTGLQKAYEQANRLVARLRQGNSVILYDQKGHQIGHLLPAEAMLYVPVCVSRDNLGSLATNLSLLLEKEPTDPYPWAVCVLDLSSLAEAWEYLKWGSKQLRKYLDQRSKLHGKAFSDDELDFAGYFIRHGGIDEPIDTKDALIQLDPSYANIFDDIYRHVHQGGPPPGIEHSKPVLLDFKRSLLSGSPTFVDDPPGARVCEKTGRNSPCPCGSGRNYKRCHGQV